MHVFPPHVPALHVSVPVLAHAPVPQLVGLVRLSSIELSQSSSMLLHVSVVGVPGVQLFCSCPLTQVSIPVLAHAPVPQLVDVDT